MGSSSLWRESPNAQRGPPTAEDVDDALKLAAAEREMVLDIPLWVSPSDDHPGLLETPQSLHQQRTGDARQAALELVEVVDAIEQLANDQQRPPASTFWRLRDLGGSRIVLAATHF